MTTVTYEQDLAVPASAAWDVLFDFGGFLKWAGGGRGTIELDGDGIGMVRKMDIPGVGEIQEKLVLREPENKTLSYQLVGGQPIGMGDYKCVVKLTGTGDTCRIGWHGEFDAAPGHEAAKVADDLKGSYVGMSGALEAYAKGQ